jgi:hypothetical protein
MVKKFFDRTLNPQKCLPHVVLAAVAVDVHLQLHDLHMKQHKITYKDLASDLKQLSRRNTQAQELTVMAADCFWRCA